MGYGKGGGGSKQTRGCGGAPDFARQTGRAPNSGQTASSRGRAPSSGQTKMPADQGGRRGSGKD